MYGKSTFFLTFFGKLKCRKMFLSQQNNRTEKNLRFSQFFEAYLRFS